MANERQLIIIGGGPAGLSAGIYAARERIEALLIEKALPGGLIAISEWVENYPAFPEGISGLELGERMQKQAAKFGLETLTAEVTGLELKDKLKIVKTSEGDFTARAVIIAGGSDRIKLEVPGEEEFAGRGVSYCATCDAAFFTDQNIAIVGGGNSAISEALHLTKYASKVTMIHRRDQFRATPILQEKARSEPKLAFLMNSVVETVEGRDTVEKMKIKNVVTGEKSVLDVSGVFVAIGQKPSTGYLKDFLALDGFGYIITNEKMETSVPGVFAAGDIRSNSIRQAVSACGDGAVAAIYASRFISE